MELTRNGAVRADGALTMSRLSIEALSPDAAEIARLVRLTLGGDSSAFEHIVMRYQTRVMRLAARLLGTRDDAQDVAQEVFLRAFKYLHRLDLEKPVEPWLMRIAVNVCRDTARKRQQRRDTFVATDQPEVIDGTADLHAGLLRKQEREVMQRALSGLPEKERLAIILRDVEGFSTAEVASILRSSDTTVRSQISRGRLKLKLAVEAVIGRAS